MTALVVRGLAAPDRSAWQALWRDYNAFYGRLGDTALSPQVVDTAWQRLLDPDEPVAGFLAHGAGQALGLMHLVRHHNMIQLAQTCYLQDLFTTPPARGQGVARALIEGAADWCAANGIRDLYWHTRADNAPARRLYDQVASDTGFVVYRKTLTPATT